VAVELALAEPTEHQNLLNKIVLHMMQTAQVDTLLRIHPLELEHQFWNSQEIRSKMCVLDVIAFALVVPNLVAAVLGRVKRHLPDGVTLPWGAKAILIMYWFLSLVPVLLMLTRMGWYNTWRQPLVLINRTYRAVSVPLDHRTTTNMFHGSATLPCLPSSKSSPEHCMWCFGHALHTAASCVRWRMQRFITIHLLRALNSTKRFQCLYCKEGPLTVHMAQTIPILCSTLQHAMLCP